MLVGELMKEPRICLTVPDFNDRMGLVALWTNQQVRQFLGGVVPLDKATLIADQIIAEAGASMRWSIKSKTDSLFLGLIGLDQHHDGQDIELSYQLLPEYHSQGFASEAIKLVLGYAKETLGMKRIVAETQIRNQDSCRLLATNGFILERTCVRFDEDQALYAKTL